MTGSFIPYGAYWCSPFARWQGSLGHLPSVEFAAHVTRESLASRGIGTEVFDSGVLGMTVPQQFSFYGLPWLAGMVGADHIGGPTIGQACATSARVLSVATQEITTGSASCVLTVTTDRLSNGPHLYYPRPGAPGGIGAHEDWVPDNMGWDPYTRGDMTQTAENCASKWNVTTAEQHEVVLRRLEQYNDALADDSAFLKRFMPLPFDVPDARFRKTVSTMNGDEGIFQSTAEGLAKLRTVKEGGTITFGGQTHPADGTAGMVVTTEEKAKELSADPAITIKVGTGRGRHRHRRPCCDQVAQPVCSQRHRFRPGDRRGPDVHEQLRQLPDLGPSTGTDRNARNHRTDRGTHTAGRRLGPVPGLCRR